MYALIMVELDGSHTVAHYDNEGDLTIGEGLAYDEVQRGMLLSAFVLYVDEDGVIQELV